MTHLIDPQQAKRGFKLNQLQKIAASLNVTPGGDKRETETGMNAIVAHQSSQLLHVDSQALAQAELEEHIEAQAIAVALVAASPDTDAEQKSVCFEKLLDKPFSQLTKEELNPIS